jgi:hypothetical protein
MMEKIKHLFDPSKDIYRTIEKVINYNVSQESRLKTEISEYVVTESIEDQLEKLLAKMQAAMDMGGENEVGVWVSGFYGSGKSSFTKYLGLALDEKVTIDGVPFLQHLQNRLHRPQTKALLNTVARRFPAAVIFLDLASEMLAGATMEEVSTVLYFKVLQWAGYSQNLKVAAFERKLKKDGRFQEFQQKIMNELNVEWQTIQNDPLVVDSIIPEIAHQMYPQLFKTPASFNTETKDFVQFENIRVQEMLDIVREVSGKEYVIFIIDEVGQYVASRPHLILNLDGLAKNLKNIGNGKVWIFATAQQTLTEDDPRAAINTPQLYKLKDRFPITVDLESKDIKEICYRRLLGKSPEGERILEELFERYGQELRHNTRLVEAKYYDSDFTKESFCNLYPFLPAHFDILLHLLGALAKSTGGIGLRSAIKVIQDILIEGTDGQTPIVEQPVGWLATTVTIFDSLEKDIAKAFPDRYKSAEKAIKFFKDSPIHQEVAKTVLVLQILNNLPVTSRNVAALMHPGVNLPSRYEEVERAVADLINETQVPFGEQDGNLCFFSERMMEIEKERSQIPLRSIEIRRIFNEALREVFSPLPSTRLNGTLAVTSGLKNKRGSALETLNGDGNTIQTIIELVPPTEYETARTSLQEESRHHTAKYFIYLLGRTAPEIDEKTAEIYRSHEICRMHRNDPDPDVRKYCQGQLERATKLAGELQRTLKNCLSGGSLIFRGQVTAVEGLDQDLLEACKKHLNDVAAQVFDRNTEAPVRVDTTLAEKFLRAGSPQGINSSIDPLELVQIQGGTPRINVGHKALRSIYDYIDQNGTVEGKQLLEVFTGPPFGWSQDTLRYLIAALFMAGELKLRVSGREVTAGGQLAIEALKNNKSFRPVGVSLRTERPSLETLERAARRLTKLTGDTVLPLENEISKAAGKYLTQCQARLASLGAKLGAMKLPGAERIQSLTNDIIDILATDASGAPKRFGGETSTFYSVLDWAVEVDRELNRGLEETIKTILDYQKEIESLPNSGIPGELRRDAVENLEFFKERLAREDFYKHTPDLNTRLTALKTLVRDKAREMTAALRTAVKEAVEDLQRLPVWDELNQEEQMNAIGELEGSTGEVPADLAGLKELINQEYTLHNRLSKLKESIITLGMQRQADRLRRDRDKNVHTLRIPAKVTTIEKLDELIRELSNLKKALTEHGEIEINIQLED